MAPNSVSATRPSTTSLDVTGGSDNARSRPVPVACAYRRARPHGLGHTTVGGRGRPPADASVFVRVRPPSFEGSVRLVVGCAMRTVDEASTSVLDGGHCDRCRDPRVTAAEIPEVVESSLPQRRASIGRAWAFVALTFAMSWGLWIPVLLADPDAGQWMLVLGGFGPALAAAIMVRAGGRQLSVWLRSIVVFRLPASRYVAAAGVPVAVVAGQVAVAAATGTLVSLGELPLRLLEFVVVFVIVALVGGGQEEFGWRGWLQPVLQQRTSPLSAAMVVGVVWAVWHAPLFWLYGAYDQIVVYFYVPTTVGLSVVIALLWNRSRQSVIIAIALHASFNAANGLFVVGGQAAADPAVQFMAQGVLAVMWVTAAVVLTVKHGPELARPAPEASAEGQLT